MIAPTALQSNNNTMFRTWTIRQLKLETSKTLTESRRTGSENLFCSLRTIRSSYSSFDNVDWTEIFRFLHRLQTRHVADQVCRSTISAIIGLKMLSTMQAQGENELHKDA